MSTQHVLIIGAGLMGAATALELTRRGQRVTLVERDEPASRAGSSHGSARILRYAYPDAFYASMVAEADRLWRQLEADAGEMLVRRVGSVDHGRGSRDPHQLAQVLDVLDIAHELVLEAQARERWPMLRIESDVLYQPTAGVIDAERTVKALCRLAEAAGAQLRSQWPVHSIELGNGVTLRTPNGAALHGDQLVIAAGGFLPDLLPQLGEHAMSMLPPLEVRQENAFHFPYRDPGAAWPTVIHFGPMEVYALPGGRDANERGLKVAQFNGGQILDSASSQTQGVDPQNRERVIDYVSQWLPGVVPEPYAETTCIFTNTPDEEFVIDSVAEGVTVVSTCSGHGAKFTPLIGRIVADHVIGVERSPERFRSFSSGDSSEISHLRPAY